jgi:hypothetical protein
MIIRNMLSRIIAATFVFLFALAGILPVRAEEKATVIFDFQGGTNRNGETSITRNVSTGSDVAVSDGIGLTVYSSDGTKYASGVQTQDGSQKYGFDDRFTVTEDITLVPVWADCVKITFDPMPGTWSDGSADIKTRYTAPGNQILKAVGEPILTDDTFNGWRSSTDYLTPDDVTSSFGFVNDPGRDYNFKAVFQNAGSQASPSPSAVPVQESFSITYHTDGGIIMSNNNPIAADTTVTYDASAGTTGEYRSAIADHKKFAAWATVPDYDYKLLSSSLGKDVQSEVIDDQGNQVFTVPGLARHVFKTGEHIDVYPVWQTDGIYTVTVNANGLGEYYIDNAHHYEQLSNSALLGQKNGPGMSWPITFYDGNYDDEIAGYSLKPDGYVIVSTREGLPSYKPEHDVTLYARRGEIISVTIDYDASDIQNQTLQLLKGGSLDMNDYAVQRNGYELEGWTIDGNVYSGGAISSECVVKAVWKNTASEPAVPAEVKMAVSEPEVKLAINTPEAQKVAEQLQKHSDITEQNVMKVDSSITDQLDALTSNTVVSEGQKIVYQSYFDIRIENVGADAVTINLTPMVRAAIMPEEIDDQSAPDGTTVKAIDGAVVKNTVLVNSKTAIEIKLPVGDLKPVDNKVYVRHVKDNGTSYVYTAVVSGGIASFTNTHGFSQFILSAADPSAAKVNGIGYMDLQTAVNDVREGETIDIINAEGQNASVGREVSFFVNNSTSVSINAASGFTLERIGNKYIFRKQSESKQKEIAVKKETPFNIVLRPAGEKAVSDDGTKIWTSLGNGTVKDQYGNIFDGYGHKLNNATAEKLVPNTADHTDILMHGITAILSLTAALITVAVYRKYQ